MICPSCRRGLPPGPHERCPFCAATLSGPVEGALAADPQPDPEPRERVEPLRDVPGARRRERTWKDEVRERVRQRRRERSGQPELPLFPEGDEEADIAEPREDGLEPRLDDADMAAETMPEEDRSSRQLGEFAGEEERAEEWSLGLPAEPAVAARPVERPARLGERLQAALVDLVLMSGLWGVVLYFASRTAHVTMSGLRPVWPYLLAYLAGLGLAYATYFTGTTGQTLGKMAVGLRVVDATGRPPGYLRALGRAALGSLGVLLAGSGLVPLLLDPARRALHDRVLKTRLVRG